MIYHVNAISGDDRHPGSEARPWRTLQRAARAARAGDRRPVLLQLHGGAWGIGERREQGRRLLTHLAARGWICAAPSGRRNSISSLPMTRQSAPAA